eukprot:1634152-Prymnesium_polylepis.1
MSHRVLPRIAGSRLAIASRAIEMRAHQACFSRGSSFVVFECDFLNLSPPRHRKLCGSEVIVTNVTPSLNEFIFCDLRYSQ